MSGFPQLPGYEIQSELGRGGMAVVYSAIEADLGRQVAIKVVRGDATEPGHIQRLENEARGLAALHHPHIVDLYRFGRTEDGSLFYVMPLLPGGSLEDVPKPMPEERVVALLDNLLDALAHAHAADIIHRDIKPANILFDRHGRPLLADFGAAFMRKRDARLTSHGHAIGSSGFMSPEQARGMAVDARSDLYSVAVLAFELLTGKMPFEGEDALSTALAQIEQPVPLLPEQLKHWQSFFYRALAVNAEHRYSRAAAMRAAIHALRASAPRETASRVLPIALAIGVLLLVVASFALWKSRSPKAPASVEAGRSEPAPAATTPAEPGAPASDAAPAELPAAAKPTKVGDRFSDPGGPPMVLARAAKGSQPGLAVMAAPVDVPLYKRYLAQRHRDAVACSNPAAPAQGCLPLATATDLARWLSEETGEKYRVPSREELQSAIAQVVRTNAHAWTGTCNEVRHYQSRNAVQRGWSHVRKAFGKPKPVPYSVRCEGNYTLKLDGRGGAATARESAAPETVVVLARNVSAKQ
jgi:hypothetical protein